MRLLLAILVALSLIGSPSVAVAAAPLTPCTMPMDQQDGGSHHDKMDCCTPNCAAPAAPALLPPETAGDAPVAFARADLWHKDAPGLPSFNPPSIDHPPRRS
ncbi:hypothetical protein E2493_02680 [Sphingomonas parva]|uniref:Uncharacterized protein n=1 Tax=Sphingomonas parva TaxID=2555898 RepID=A0A4Y8ZUQ5_9SPHN|nr:hypothetical protein [Sphingomonas parva]TFI59763.1 hypothetical protein E2493_02680 [Sphingomonas parva]